jgi:hypothetical protein
MKRLVGMVTVLGAWVALGVSSASAQLGVYNPPQVTPGPAFSPYLNMIRNNPAANYFGIVQPQMNTYGALQQLQQDVRYGQAGAVAQGMTSQAIQGNGLITGHPVLFGYTSQYFPMSGNQLAGMGMGMAAGPNAGLGVGGFGNGLGANIGGIGMGAGPTINTPLPLGFVPR